MRIGACSHDHRNICHLFESRESRNEIDAIYVRFEHRTTYLPTVLNR